VPLNPLLKADQVAYILRDCNVRALVTSPERLPLLAAVLPTCHDLRHVILVNPDPLPAGGGPLAWLHWDDLLQAGAQKGHRVIDTDMAAILYTSGSTGKPKGVVLSHRNMVAGAKSVASYLEIPLTTPCSPPCRCLSMPASASSPPPSTPARASCCSTTCCRRTCSRHWRASA
jgi:long-subunit acyl-CoA synthetase (AMP-forming)